MSSQVAILIATAVLAFVAVTAAIVAVRALHQLRTESTQGDRVAAYRDHPQSRDLDTRLASSPLLDHQERALDHREVAEPDAGGVRVVEGRVIVQPTQEQVVAATMTRTSVRFAIFTAGLAHALRPESRDRISGLMRREYRSRRRARQRAARAAARVAAPERPTRSTGEGWVGS